MRKLTPEDLDRHGIEPDFKYKLEWLRDNTCSFGIEFNEHRNYYQTIEQLLDDERPSRYAVDATLRAEILAAGQIVLVQCYPSTPIGFFCVAHHDVEKAIDAAYEKLRTVPR